MTEVGAGWAASVGGEGAPGSELVRPGGAARRLLRATQFPAQ
jgi:hypothetical protein